MPPIKLSIKRRALTASYCAPCVAGEFQEQTRKLTESQFGPSGLQATELAIVPTSGTPTPAMADPTTATWSGIVAIEGQMTGDGRLIELGALRWDDLPIPLRWCEEDDGGHAGAVVVGLIETLSRDASGNIIATGFVDLASENGQKAAQLMEKGMLRGVSIDPDDVDFEIRVKAELLDAGVNDLAELDDQVQTQEFPPADADGYVTVMKMASDDEILVITSGRLRAATLVDTPAFSLAVITLDAALPEIMPMVNDEAYALVAAGAKIAVRPPAAWFGNPGLSGPTALTVTDDGRVFGHVSTWNSCHLGFESCVTAPHSQTNYAWFRTGVLVADDGTEHPVGQITMSTGHAGQALNPTQTLSHYDNTGFAVADVNAGEDAHGIWVAGALRPGVTDEQKRELRASGISPDWRRIGGNLEMVATLAVNVPGFPIPRGLVASGHIQSLQLPAPTMDALVAAGFAPSEPDVVQVDDSIEFTTEDMRELRALLASNRAIQAERDEAAAEMARGILADDLAREMRS